ncbi:beta-glucoside-specific PTS transporter subunit IIABC [Pediococcus siamensis]|uniref:beta-glucoside-specific PTS transporter subunit IIABC n=1 Tax=Pediococcus siamensis TaxID=381829 RepID=UPI0039A08BF3
MQDLNKIAKKIIKDIGGKKNISQFTHCFTRLRFNLKDNNKINREDLNSIHGVKGVTVNNGQLQIIIGTDVDTWYDAINEYLGDVKSNFHEPNNKGIMNKIIDIITGIFIPVFPALAAGGLLKGILIGIQFAGLVKSTEPTFALLMMISDVPFYFLPIILAFSSAKKFGANQYTALLIAGTLLHPTYVAMKTSTTFLGLTVPHITYSSTVFPILLSVALLAVVEKQLKNIIPKSVAMLFVPLFSVIITAPIALIIIGPVANWLGELVGNGIVHLYQMSGAFGGAIFGAIYPFLVFTGLHQALPPIELQNLATSGVDVFLGLAAVANASVAGTTIMAALRSNDVDFRSLAFSSGLSAILGTTEPAIYGVLAKSKRNFVAAFIGGGIGGAIIGFFKVSAVGMGPVPIPAIALFAGNKFLIYVISISLSFSIGMLACLLLNKEKKNNNTSKSEVSNMKAIDLVSPVNGEVISLKEMNDPTFASGAMGNGVAIIPSDGRIVAPMDATVEAVFPTKHAIGLSNGSTELIIHVGVNTVELKGKPFKSYVKNGDKVKQGQLLLTFNLQEIKNKGYDPTTALIINNKAHETQAKIITGNNKHQKIRINDPLLTAQF